MLKPVSKVAFAAVMTLLLVTARVSAAEPPATLSKDTIRAIDRYCLSCHDSETKKGDFALDALLEQPLTQHPAVWEDVIRRLTTRQMPPPDRKRRPSEAEYEALVAAVAAPLDAAAAAHPNAGRTDSIRRLTRTEYANAIRDLLALDIDAAAMLPPDQSSHGFDNITVTDLSPALLDRYLSAAQEISRLAVGAVRATPALTVVRLPADLTQEKHIPGLPIGTRGGVLINHHFPQTGEYEIAVRLSRDRNEHVEGLHEPHDMELLLDRERVALIKVTPPGNKKAYEFDDSQLKTRITVEAGPHNLGVTFLKDPGALQETLRQPFEAHFNFHRHPRLTPAVYQVSITGPFSPRGPGAPGSTPSRQRIFTTYPVGSAPRTTTQNVGSAPRTTTQTTENETCAKQILTTLMRRAYRRPVTDEDLATPMALYRQASADQGDQGDQGFEAGIELALSAILVNPNFLFRVERDPPEVAPGSAYQISDLELASRLSFFLWSSIPDDELLDAAIKGELRKPEVLDAQVRRMLADPRSQSLVTNFADQWLHLRNLESITPDLRLYPDFDDNLRQAMRTETQLLFEHILREDRSVLELLSADYTFLNERLAKHYGIPHIYGSRFRRVDLPPEAKRGGILRHGSILTVTSYATRTSPVIRGQWVLENILGTPAPPPPANVPALKDNTVAANLSIRERLAEHRANPACSSCHELIDPPGFALENFDAVGRWRTHENGQPVDASGGLPDGSEFAGVDGLEAALLNRPDLFVRTMAERMLTFALGRGVETYDAPAIRQIVRRTRDNDYRFSAMVLAIVHSTPFQMRNPNITAEHTGAAQKIENN